MECRASQLVRFLARYANPLTYGAPSFTFCGMAYEVTGGGVREDGRWVMHARDTEGGDVEYRVEVTPRDGQLRLTRLDLVVDRKSPSELQSADLRRVRLHSLLTAVRSEVMRAVHHVDTDPGAPEATRRAIAPGSQTAPPRRGRPSLPDEHYERIARRYLELLDTGLTRGILQRLAEEENRPVQTVRTWVNVARSDRYQYLTPGESGRAGAMPGPGLPPAPRATRRNKKGRR